MMDTNQNQFPLTFVKTLHTLVWIFFNIVLVYLYYAVLTRKIDVWFWWGIGAYALEFVILIAYRWTCPLTFWARRYSDSDRDNFDIYLPNWLARHTKTIYSSFIILLLLIFIFTQINF